MEKDAASVYGYTSRLQANSQAMSLGPGLGLRPPGPMLFLFASTVVGRCRLTLSNPS